LGILVWWVRHGRLSLRALDQSIRPKPTTPLMIAPYWNTEPSRGDVCEGDMRRPREAWELVRTGHLVHSPMKPPG
jgi:hypothetical protein